MPVVAIRVSFGWIYTLSISLFAFRPNVLENSPELPKLIKSATITGVGNRCAVRMMRNKIAGKIGPLILLLLVVLIGGAGYVYVNFFDTAKTISDLLRDNQQLKEGISNLTRENQIGYAKVLAQENRDGQIYTRLLFVETDRNDPLKRVLEKEYEIIGDLVHFDALMVKFDGSLVLDGRERSLYLWRRVYGETMTPQAGFAIETPESEPKRYADICAKLSLEDRKLFWDEIWQLSNNPDALASLGIRAIYGNVVYQRIMPGLIYVFKVGDLGDLYPEVVLDL